MDWQSYTSIIESSILFIGGSYAIIAIFLGARNIFRGHVNKISVQLLITGIIISIAFSIYSFFITNKLSELSQLMIEESSISELDDNWGKDSPPEERTENSKALASVYLTEKGKIGSYFNVNGQKERYCATEGDIAVRDLKIKAQCDLNQAISSAESKGWGWLFHILTSVMLGYVAARKEFESLFKA